MALLFLEFVERRPDTGLKADDRRLVDEPFPRWPPSVEPHPALLGGIWP
jgi:hypothetical protein